MKTMPAGAQIEALRRVRGPLVLFYEFSGAEPASRQSVLAGLARRHGGELRWAAAQEQVLIGRMPLFGHAACVHFPSAAAAEACATDPAHAAAFAPCTALQVAVLGEQPRALAMISTLMSWILPSWPFDNMFGGGLEGGDEPGIGVSTVMPGTGQMVALRTHPEQASPVVMINWLKFRRRESYFRYGRVALVAAHSLGAKLLHAARYRLTLVGNDGDPAEQRWDEFALVQYPGRAAFQKMAALRRYRRALPDREDGLAEWGQGLIVSKPPPEFTWQRSSSKGAPRALLIAGLAAGALMAAFGLRPESAGLPPEAVARVDQRLILRDAWLRAVAAVASERRTPLTDADQRHILDRLIDEELLVQHGVALGLVQHDARLRSTLVSEVIQAASLSARAEADESALRAYYDDNRARFAPAARLRVRAWRIGDAGERVPFEPAVPDALLPVAKLQAYLGPALTVAARGLPPGATSEPIAANGQRVVLQVSEREAGEAPPFEALRDQIALEVRRRADEAALRSLLAELRERTPIQVRAGL